MTLIGRLHRQLGGRVVYGQFPSHSPGLAGFYFARGYELVPEGHGLNLESAVGLAVGIAPSPGEQLFAYWCFADDKAVVVVPGHADG